MLNTLRPVGSLFLATFWPRATHIIYNYGIHNDLLLNASRSPLTLTCPLYYYDLTGIQFTYYLLATIWCYVQRTFMPNALFGNTEFLPGVYTVYYFICIFYLQSSSIPPEGHALFFYIFICMYYFDTDLLLKAHTTSQGSHFDIFIWLYVCTILYWLIIQSPIMPHKGHALWFYTFTCMFKCATWFAYLTAHRLAYDLSVVFHLLCHWW